MQQGVTPTWTCRHYLIKKAVSTVLAENKILQYQVNTIF